MNSEKLIMDIVFFSSAFLRNMKESTGITIVSLAENLIKKGQKVIMITEKRKGYPKFEKMNNVPIYRPFKSRIMAHAKTIDYLKQNLGFKFDIIHNFSASPLLSIRAILAKKLYAKNSKIVHTLKSYPKRSFGFARVLNFVDIVTVPTAIMKSNLVSKGVKSEKIRIIHSFINIKKFIPLNKQKLKSKYRYKDKKLLFYYGSLYEKKGVKYLLKALPYVIKENPDILLILASRHKIPEDYIQLIKELDINNHIEIITQDINVVEYVNLADIVILPYIDLIGTEGNPSCLLESIACKTPVVTTYQPELREIVTPNKDVLMAIPKDEISLANNINKLLKDKKLKKSLAENAYKKIKKFDIDVISRQFLSLYNSILE